MDFITVFAGYCLIGDKKQTKKTQKQIVERQRKVDVTNRKVKSRTWESYSA